MRRIISPTEGEVHGEVPKYLATIIIIVLCQACQQDRRRFPHSVADLRSHSPTVLSSVFFHADSWLFDPKRFIILIAVHARASYYESTLSAF